MAEVPTGVTESTPKPAGFSGSDSVKSSITSEGSRQPPKKNRVSVTGWKAGLVRAGLGLGLTFGVGAPVVSEAINPTAADAAGETPTPNALRTAIAQQSAENTKVAATAKAEAEAKKREQEDLNALNRLQNDFNRTQDQRAANAQAIPLPPAERTATALAARREAQATREAGRVATVTAQAATANAVAATATQQSVEARATATEQAIINRETRRREETKSMQKTTLSWFGGSILAAIVLAITKNRAVLRENTWDKLMKFLNIETGSKEGKH